MSTCPVIRCREDHLGAIRAIFNDAILNTTALYEYQPRSEATILAWWQAKQQAGYPVLGVEHADGSLAGIAMNGATVADFEELRKRVIGLVGTDTGPNSLAERTEVELDCDYSLKYVNVVRAITAVSGKVQDGQIVELIKKIKFTPPKRG